MSDTFTEPVYTATSSYFSIEGSMLTVYSGTGRSAAFCLPQGASGCYDFEHYPPRPYLWMVVDNDRND